MPGADMTMADGYLAAVAERLDGPRSTRTAILDELRDGLYEACTAWRARGLDAQAAVAAALREFGPPAGLARGFAGELATARARRIALAYLATGPMVGAPWLLALQPVSGPRSHGPAGAPVGHRSRPPGDPRRRPRWTERGRQHRALGTDRRVPPTSPCASRCADGHRGGRRRRSRHAREGRRSRRRQGEWPAAPRRLGQHCPIDVRRSGGHPVAAMPTCVLGPTDGPLTAAPPRRSAAVAIPMRRRVLRPGGGTVVRQRWGACAGRRGAAEP